MRCVVIDIEASGFDGFPVEVGWCDQDGNGESHLIRPAWNWTAWDIRAERVHGITREHLAAQGEPFGTVARLVADMLARCRRKGVIVASDNADYDREWLLKLFRRADIEVHVHLANVSDLYGAAMEPLVALHEGRHQRSEEAHEQARIVGEAVIQACRTRVAARPYHRAADDARRLRDIVEMIRTEVTKALKQERLL